MKNNIIAFDDLAFESLGDLKWYISRGCEIEFIWNGKYYSITHPDGRFCIGEGCYLKDGKMYNLLSNTEYDTANSVISDDINDIIEYTLGEDKLRNVATKIGIVYRSI